MACGGPTAPQSAERLPRVEEEPPAPAPAPDNAPAEKTAAPAPKTPEPPPEEQDHEQLRFSASSFGPIEVSALPLDAKKLRALLPGYDVRRRTGRGEGVRYTYFEVSQSDELLFTLEDTMIKVHSSSIPGPNGMRVGMKFAALGEASCNVPDEGDQLVFCYTKPADVLYGLELEHAPATALENEDDVPLTGIAELPIDRIDVYLE